MRCFSNVFFPSNITDSTLMLKCPPFPETWTFAFFIDASTALQICYSILTKGSKGKRFMNYIHVGLMFSSCLGASNINEVLQPHEDFAMGLLNFRPRSIKL